jgi:glycosyltransferase involved in cell wall biosynthesis
LHGRLDLPDLPVIYAEFPQMPLISISDHQRKPLSWLNWCATVHHGLPRTRYKAGAGRGGYLAFIGRISPEKRLDTAIEIARRFGMPLRIAAKVDKVDRIYFEEVIRRCWVRPMPSFWARSTMQRKVGSWATPQHSCFPSIGRNPSA